MRHYKKSLMGWIGWIALVGVGCGGHSRGGSTAEDPAGATALGGDSGGAETTGDTTNSGGSDGTSGDNGNNNDDGKNGSDPQAPSISSLKDSGGNVLSGAASVNLDGLFTLVFSEAMDPTSVSTESITASCNGVSLNLTIAKTSNSEFAIAASVWPNNNCVVTVAGGEDGVKSADGLPMAESAVWTLSPACGFDEQFASADVLSNGCWDVYNDHNYAAVLDSQTSNEDLLTMHITPDNSESDPPRIDKKISGDFAATVYFAQVSADQALEKVFANVSAHQDVVADKMELRFGKGILANKFMTKLILTGGAGAESSSLGSSAGSAVYFCFIRSGNSVTAQYSFNGTSFTAVAGSATMSDSFATLELGGYNNGGDGMSAKADWVSIQEGAATCPTL